MADSIALMPWPANVAFPGDGTMSARAFAVEYSRVRTPRLERAVARSLGDSTPGGAPLVIGCHSASGTVPSLGDDEAYSLRVLRALLEEPASELDLTVFANRRLARSHPEELASVPVAIAPVDGGSRPARIAAESTWLPREASRRRLDLVHHMADVVPWLRGQRSVLTIHDLRALHRPDILGTPHAAYLRARLRPSVRASASAQSPRRRRTASSSRELAGMASLGPNPSYQIVPGRVRTFNFSPRAPPSAAVQDEGGPVERRVALRDQPALGPP